MGHLLMPANDQPAKEVEFIELDQESEGVHLIV
jgi:hypothetical protein